MSYTRAIAYEGMFSPTRTERTEQPFEGLTLVQIRRLAARFGDKDSLGRIAFREGKKRGTIQISLRRALKRVRANGWDIAQSAARAA